MAITILLAAADGTGCALLSRMHGLCFPKGWKDHEFAAMLAMPGAFAFLAANTDGSAPEPMGFVLARAAIDERLCEAADKLGSECKIITIGVIPDCRGRGIGARLVDAVAVKAKALGAEDLLLEVAENNQAAMVTYLARGFTDVGRRKNYYANPAGGTIDAIVMRRNLSSG